MSRDAIVTTGLDPVILEQSSKLKGDGRSKSGHDDWSSSDFGLSAFIVVRS